MNSHRKISFVFVFIGLLASTTSITNAQESRDRRIVIPSPTQQRPSVPNSNKFHPIVQRNNQAHTLLTSIDDDDPKDADSKRDSEKNTLPAPKLDKSLIRDGVIAFQERCVTCHDAQKSLSLKRSFTEWMETVERMAKEDGADIPVSTHKPIATYLTSVSAQNQDSKSDNASKDKTKDDKKEKDDTKSKVDPKVIEEGKTAFQAYCVSCHDAQKSLEVKKGVSAWKSTIQRMAEKDGAQIPANTFEPMAQYLASLNGDSKSGDSGSSGSIASSPLTITGTVSPWFRGGGSENLELPGFFGDVWIGAQYNTDGPVSARATACNTCHSDGAQLGRFDLVEASIRIDMMKALGLQCERNDWRASIQAGRFVVPFGVYYQQSNPGVDRAVTRPLIYNMGQRVYATDIGEPVLPMPYSDEGSAFNIGVPFGESTKILFDGYVVNGLEGTSNGINYYKSRDYTDNNRYPAGGGRVSISGQYLQLGASLMAGRFNSDSGVGDQKSGLDYRIFGTDALFQWKDSLRIQMEYAQRDSERYGSVPALQIFNERVAGAYIQTEVLIEREKKLSFFFRYDNQLTHSLLLPVGSQLNSGDFRVERLTYGINKTLKGGSLLMVNYEHWLVPSPLSNVDLIGVRWAASF